MTIWPRIVAIGVIGIALNGIALSGGTALGQTVVVEPAPAPVPDPVLSAGSFDRLSPGNQKIARSLFEAQTVDPNGPIPLNLDQIAALKTGVPSTTAAPGTTGTGWGNAFKQMQAQGLVGARNLGQVVSGHYVPPAPAATAPATSSSVVVTTGSGRNFVAGGDKGGGKSVTTAAGGNSGKTTTGNGHAKAQPFVATAGGSSAGAVAGATGGGAKGGGKAVGHTK